MTSHHTTLGIRRVYPGYETAHILGVEYPQLHDMIRTGAANVVHNPHEQAKCDVRVWVNVDSILLVNLHGPSSVQGFSVSRMVVDEE